MPREGKITTTTVNEGDDKTDSNKSTDGMLKNILKQMEELKARTTSTTPIQEEQSRRCKNL